MNGLAKMLADHLLTKKIIASEQLDDHYFGFQVLFSNIIPMLIALIMGAILHLLPATLFFLAFFVLPRMLAGGYHAPRFWICLLLFGSTAAAFFWSLSWISSFNHVLVILAGISLPILICMISAVKSYTLLLSTTDQDRDRRLKTCIVVYIVGISMILILAIIDRWNFRLTYSACAGLFAAAVSYLVQFFQKKGEI